ncbi:Sensory transduction protein LytR [Dyadobacter sp. CECT 9275]|uniref:Sensory transduction protein LytR n=1 Tax=Dyadobacter helix TaxID=2822344 RepID=A0A916JAC3_9BACT|nr:LytTR family DNA-binding domain-containing protein [Dyadobacter sp. CECT 9275]CAG4997258.1 Sensory transduction protein LytR [Dyadobacter sp. CECT 9275]
MKVLIIEDEAVAARRLQNLLHEVDPSIEVVSVVDSIEDAVLWFGEFAHPELIFMDIMLADGQSFEIFEHVEIKVPIIFTTAYDEFAIKAFKVNSIDYLLKPIELPLLADALKKFHSLIRPHQNMKEVIASLLVTRQGNEEPRPDFKNRFLVKLGDKFIPIPISEVSYFSFEDKISFLYTNSNRRYMLDHTLDELEKLVDPTLFFRLNRQYIVSFSAIKSVHNYFNGKLKVFTEPLVSAGIIVSKERAQSFKSWLNK